MEIEGSICLIEWGARVATAFEDFMRISISLVPVHEAERRFEVSAQGPRSNCLMQKFIKDCDILWV